MPAVSGWRGAMLKTVTERDNLIDRLETTLDSHETPVEHVSFEPARRQTGPGLIWDRPGAIVDVYLTDSAPRSLAETWEKHARLVLDAIGWTHQTIITRPFQGGVHLALSAPPDQLYSAVLAARIAWHYCAAELMDRQSLIFAELIADLKSIMAQEANPALISLITEATAQEVDILFDDDTVSIGHGVGSRTWPIDDLPTVDDVAWRDLHDIPLALITGTNGKTTTTRLCAAIARAAGKVVGLTSTDMVRVGDEVLDRGDYSGPAGGRMVLRDPRAQIAFLEVARGGILRRGLPTRRARVAAVTNVARDHLGEYGVTTLADLAETKFAVARSLAEDGVLILNADDPNVLEAAKAVTSTIWWFSLDPATSQIAHNRAMGRPCAYLKQDVLTFFDGKAEAWSLPVADVPITLAGAARHNIQNVLASLCVSKALGMPGRAITTALTQFISDPRDNPGRLNEFQYNGARIFVDFAHNPHSIAAVCDALAAIPSKRRLIMLSQPGDRSDQDISDAMATALRFRPDLIVVTEIADYLRGRALHETPALLERSAIANGVQPEKILHAASPSEGAKRVLDEVWPGDLALLLVLSDREDVVEILEGSRA